jgi:hypothetical protein
MHSDKYYKYLLVVLLDLLLPLAIPGCHGCWQRNAAKPW